LLPRTWRVLSQNLSVNNVCYCRKMDKTYPAPSISYWPEWNTFSRSAFVGYETQLLISVSTSILQCLMCENTCPVLCVSDRSEHSKKDQKIHVVCWWTEVFVIVNDVLVFQHNRRADFISSPRCLSMAKVYFDAMIMQETRPRWSIAEQSRLLSCAKHHFPVVLPCSGSYGVIALPVLTSYSW
jgi:hypothetical protein